MHSGEKTKAWEVVGCSVARSKNTCTIHNHNIPSSDALKASPKTFAVQLTKKTKGEKEQRGFNVFQLITPALLFQHTNDILIQTNIHCTIAVIKKLLI